MRTIKQKDRCGCGIACMAMVVDEDQEGECLLFQVTHALDTNCRFTSPSQCR